MTNLILARYQKLAAKRNIQITFQADLPEELPINDDDLAQLLIHALEHSFRETHAIENPLYRKIYLSIHEQEEHFVICCEHSAHYDTNLFSRGITEELDDQERFDLMMMKDVADRYTGTLTQEKILSLIGSLFNSLEITRILYKNGSIIYGTDESELILQPHFHFRY